MSRDPSVEPDPKAWAVIAKCQAATGTWNFFESLCDQSFGEWEECSRGYT